MFLVQESRDSLCSWVTFPITETKTQAKWLEEGAVCRERMTAGETGDWSHHIQSRHSGRMWFSFSFFFSVL